MRNIFALATLTLCMDCVEEVVKEPYHSFPREIRQWSVREDDRFYDRQTLYNYIDGGAELYLTYHFQEAFIRRFTKAGDPETEIVLDVYDMGSSEEAFGIFSCEREDEEIGVGQDSEYGGGLLRFWKDRYFVSMVALGGEEEAKPVMMELARTVAEAIPSTGERPRLVSRLPGEGLVEDEIRFFHTMQCLNNRYFIASENILELDEETDCVFAAYERDRETGFVLLVQYVDERDAESAYGSFLQVYMPEADPSGSARMENGRWTLARTEGPYLFVVFDAPTREWGERILSEIANEG